MARKIHGIFLNKKCAIMNSSLDKLVKNLSDNDFKYLTKEFVSKNLELLKENGTYPCEYMDSFKRFNQEELTDKQCFCWYVKGEKTGENGEKLNGHISHEEYLMCKRFGKNLAWKIWMVITIIFWKKMFCY